jgi:hypothetical protein
MNPTWTRSLAPRIRRYDAALAAARKVRRVAFMESL